MNICNPSCTWPDVAVIFIIAIVLIFFLAAITDYGRKR